MTAARSRPRSLTAGLPDLVERVQDLDATRLDEARSDAEKAENWKRQAAERAGQAQDQHARELGLLQERQQQAQASGGRLGADLLAARELATATGVAAALERALEGVSLPEDADTLSADSPERLRRAAEDAAQARARQIELLRKHLRELAEAQRVQAGAAADRQARADDFDQAADAVDAAQRAQRAAGEALLQAARQHLQNLRALPFDDADAVLAALEDWIDSGAGDNPLRQALQQARSARERQLALDEAALHQQQRALDEERDALSAERAALARGDARTPPMPYTRAPDARRERAGAPLWQLVDFADGVDTASRAGLEAALQAAGLLDAWVTPDGALLDALTQDVQLIARAPVTGDSLRRWLRADLPPQCGVSAATVDALLAAVAAGETDTGEAEAWISPQGAYRVGPAQGAWSKTAAEFIGHAARAAARERRLAEIAARLDALAGQAAALAQQIEAIARTREAVRAEAEAAPGDEALLRAQADFAASERQRRAAQERLAHAEARLAAANAALARARDALEIDAADLGLPADAPALDALARSLHEFRTAATVLAGSLREHRRDRLELGAQHEREQRTGAQAAQTREQAELQARAAHQAHTRYQTLRDAIGDRVDALRAKLESARAALQAHRDEREAATKQQIAAGGRLAGAEEKARNARLRLDERSEERRAAIGVLQGFAATGLLRQALPDIELPPGDAAWGVDAARTLARRVEQALGEVPADDADWQRVQSQISGDLTELQRAMSAQGHEAISEVADDCMLVHIVYRQRAERPDRLRAQLDSERAERRMQLTAGEREILENHLQQEIAAGLQRLIQDTDRRVSATNAELERRPTSTGVRYRLAWLPADNEDAPAGLAEARARLLRTRAEAWSAEDRRVVGEFLSRRIEAERERDDQAVQLDVLANALDYRRWHRFAVQRKLSKTDPNWRPLSGPASSGEKALGLTVPLFAAASSFYESADARSPRLVLLDEAFAGIDDDARRHCMALIREFDLDFVMTSEREWACYAELPGVAISQLVRHENADAVFVSRWAWDGREKRAEADPERRFPDAVPAP